VKTELNDALIAIFNRKARGGMRTMTTAGVEEVGLAELNDYKF
jgi:hypothetical protein